MKITMKYEKETQGTVVYREVDSQGQFVQQNRDGNLPVIYFQKTSEVGRDKPKTLVAEFTYTK